MFDRNRDHHSLSDLGDLQREIEPGDVVVHRLLTMHRAQGSRDRRQEIPRRQRRAEGEQRRFRIGQGADWTATRFACAQRSAYCDA